MLAPSNPRPLDKMGGMRIKLISEPTSAGVMGLLYWLYYHSTKVKWSRLGREAYLQDKAHYFDKYVASPAPAMYSIIPLVIFALVFSCFIRRLIF